MNATNNKLHFREKFAYGFGDFASVLYWQTFMLYLTYFYTDVFLIPAGAAATMFLLTRIFDGINDPIMGMIADRTQSKWGKYRPYLLWICVPFAITGVMTFTVPDIGESGKLVWAYTTFIAIMVLYTAINIPYTALLGVISPNSIERTSVSSFKFVFAYAAGIVVSYSLLRMVLFLGDGNEIRGWQYSFVIYGIVFVAFFLIVFAFTKERVHPPKTQQSSIKQDLKELVTNKPWLILLATTITFILFIALRNSVTVHYFKYVIGNRDVALPFLHASNYPFEKLVSDFNTVNQISALIGVLVLTSLARIFGKKNVFLTFFAISILSMASFYYISPEQLGLMFFMQIVYSITSGPLSVLLWAMYADTADYAEWKNGRRATGLIFSASTMSQKFGWAIGAFVALTLMSSVGFVPNETQSPDSLDALTLLFSLIPAAFGVLSACLLLLYPLNDKRVAEIESELKLRRISSGDVIAE